MASRRDKTPKRKLSLKQRLLRGVLSAFVWLGAIILYYILYSFFFDTPTEYIQKHSTDRLRSEYEILEARYDSLRMVADNIAARDRNIFRILFESDPYDLRDESAKESRYEEILSESSSRLKRDLAQRSEDIQTRFDELCTSYNNMLLKIEQRGSECNHIPSIQPVINDNLSLLTASYGMRIHPFYKTLKSHQGVDYTIPEGSRVFATADGKVKEISTRTTSGQTVIIDHGNGFETAYSHLGKIIVRKGQSVQRGDIIALSGNSGLSLAPHLHYEIRHNGMRQDPIHYFFQELNAEEYQRIIRIAQSGMQSFD